MWGRGDDGSVGKLWVVEHKEWDLNSHPKQPLGVGAHIWNPTASIARLEAFFSQYSIVMKYISLCPDFPWMLGFSLRYS